MNYDVIVSDGFKKQLKKLLKKFPSLKKEYAALIEALETDPFQGTPIGRNCYKIRLGIASKGRGKSGGARVITHVYIARATVYLLSIYDKSDKATISEPALNNLLKNI